MRWVASGGPPTPATVFTRPAKPQLRSPECRRVEWGRDSSPASPKNRGNIKVSGLPGQAPQSPIQWLAGVRVRHAQELLETTDYTVDRIAAQAGFPSVSNFRAQFAQTVGVNAGGYRRTFRG